MSHIYDKFKFGTNLNRIRKDRRDKYKSNRGLKLNPYQKYEYCMSQELLAEHLRVERRTVGKWELGISIPPIDKVVDLCNLLDCTIDELLGAGDLGGLGKADIASKYSGISKDIITHGLNDADYLDFLNYFMDPNKCSQLLEAVSLASLRMCSSDHDLDSIKDPLKSLILNVFNRYMSITPYHDYSIDSYKQFLIDSLPKNTLSFSSRNKGAGIYVCSCIPASDVKKLGLCSRNINSFNVFADYISELSYEPLFNNAMLEIKKMTIAKSFISLFENYLSD